MFSVITFLIYTMIPKNPDNHMKKRDWNKRILYLGEGLGRISPLHVHAPNPAQLTGQRTHVFTTGHSPNSSGSRSSSR